jgi:hypothetical protein
MNPEHPPASTSSVISTRHQVVLWVLAVVALTAWLGSRGLNEPDETRYAEIAREMVTSGEWLMPHLNGIPHVQKPPMVYWLTAVSLKLLGPNEWAARLPSMLGALATLWLTAFIAGSLFGGRARWNATIILLSSLEFYLLARTLTPDMVMTFWITLAIAAVVQHARCQDHKRWQWLFFIAMGLGFLTKGPMALVIPMSAAVCLAVASRRGPDRLRINWIAGVPVTLRARGPLCIERARPRSAILVLHSRARRRVPAVHRVCTGSDRGRMAKMAPQGTLFAGKLVAHRMGASTIPHSLTERLEADHVCPAAVPGPGHRRRPVVDGPRYINSVGVAS